MRKPGRIRECDADNNDGEEVDRGQNDRRDEWIHRTTRILEKLNLEEGDGGNPAELISTAEENT